MIFLPGGQRLQVDLLGGVTMPIETLADGHQTIERGEDGRITKVSLSKERAAALGAMHTKKGQDERTNALLSARGIDPDTADEGLRVLCQIATSNRSGSVQAMKYIDTLTGYGTGQVENETAHKVEFFGDFMVSVDDRLFIACGLSIINEIVNILEGEETQQESEPKG
jgi:hypothetical protein